MPSAWPGSLFGVSRGLILLFVVMLGGQAALAQPAFLQPQSTVLTNVRILTGDGRVIERGTVVVSRGRVTQVVAGDLDEMPRRATVVDGEGRTLTPGLIDVHGRLAMSDAAGAGPLNRASDAFNRFDRAAIDAALAQGVTTVYLPALGSSVSGTGAVVHLGETPSFNEDVACLHADLGSEQPASRRLQTLASIRDGFTQAKAWRESVELYEDELLPTYEEKLAEKAKAADEEEKKKDGDGVARGTGAPTVADGEDMQPRPIRPRRGGGGQAGRGGGGRGGQGGGGDEVKKPVEPRPNREAEVLLRAIDGDLPVRMVAHRSEDILNAIELAEAFGLRLIIEGGNEAHLVADALAEAGASVLLAGAGDESPWTPERFRLRHPGAVDVLTAAGVPVVLGTGGASTTRFVLMNAQMLAAEADVDPLRLVTADAARFLGLDDAGVVRRGARADLVLWDGDPMDPGTVATRVWVGGRAAYEREDD